MSIVSGAVNLGGRSVW